MTTSSYPVTQLHRSSPDEQDEDTSVAISAPAYPEAVAVEHLAHVPFQHHVARTYGCGRSLVAAAGDEENERDH